MYICEVMIKDQKNMAKPSSGKTRDEAYKKMTITLRKRIARGLNSEYEEIESYSSYRLHDGIMIDRVIENKNPMITIKQFIKIYGEC